ncbi:hypothetical protein B9Z55_018818 [Caenorhabditis nigoni]|uniref:Uncharacterized protein n=1 Tax=Caenorhabditis nigoni TaxID=1611254 RepID=A0A2G5TFP5_9PELO|nr:hypothetical protein B9Z55_018818 [Caenorhabditis nigoni]
MWRFAIYTQKTTILSKTCMKTVKQALKHTDGRSDYFRFLSNDAAASIRPENEHSIKEVLSLDDFGLLSSNRSQSIESMSSTGDTFLEHLFRNDTLNAFSNVQIPTTMSTRELGASSDVFGYDYVSELLSEGAIPEEIAEDLAMEPSTSETEITSSFADSARYHDDQEPGTSGLEVTSLPFLIPNLDDHVPKENDKKDTRILISEKLRRERKLNLSTTAPLESPEDAVTPLFHSPITSGIPNVGEMLFPDHIPMESYTSQWKDGEAPEVVSTQASSNKLPTLDAPIEFSLDVLEGIMTEGSMSELLEELRAFGRWPEWIFTGDRRTLTRTNGILRHVVQNSSDLNEAKEVINNFISSHIRAVVPDDVLLHFTVKSINSSSNVPEIASQLENSTRIALSRELRPDRSLVEAQLIDLYTAAIKKCPKTSSTLVVLCSNLNFDRSAEIFMKCYGEVQAFAGNFLTSFDGWKKLSTKYGTQKGIENYWTAALDSEGPMEKRIEALLLHSAKTEHPFSTMARMICTFVKLDQLDKGLEVFQAVSVSGKHFMEPLAAFVRQKDLDSIERLATLIERGIIAERRRGGRQQAVNKSGKEGEKKLLLSENVHAVLAKFYGVSGHKKSKFVDKKLKKKIHRVDEAQLHELCKSIQKAWIQCANDKESVDRLVAWCQSNRVEIDDKLQKRISSFSE